jgi:tetratricopeptide (TPR) repeat protein
LIIRGDALVEIGSYREAEAALDDLQVKLPDEPSVLARLAHLAELKGKHGQALQFLERAAAKEVVEEGNGETAAWYHTRIGSLLFRTGKLDEAATAFETALRLYEGYYIALDGLADVRAAQGREGEAIGLLERAVASVPQPASLFALADLYTNSGRVADARRVSQRAESIAQRPGSYQAAYRRELAMFYAAGDRELKSALDLARQDLEIRRDIHGYDTLAWALYKNKRFDQAAEAMMKALVLGTQDATLYAHAGLIEYRRGRSSQAVAYLRSANALAPYLLDAEARRVLADLSRVPQGR